MQIDSIKLFNDDALLNESTRIGKQLLHRQCAVSSVDDLKIELDKRERLPGSIYDEYYRHVNGIIATNTEGNRCKVTKDARKVFCCFEDSAYPLEVLGICDYQKKHLITLDFSECLPLIFAMLTNCNYKTFSNIPNFNLISQEILTLRINKCENIPFSTFLNKDSYFDQWFARIVKSNVSESDDIENDALEILCNFMHEVTLCLEIVKDYACLYVANSVSGVYRSKTMASGLITTDSILDNDVIELRLENVIFTKALQDRIPFTLRIPAVANVKVNKYEPLEILDRLEKMK